MATSTRAELKEFEEDLARARANLPDLSRYLPDDEDDEENENDDEFFNRFLEGAEGRARAPRESGGVVQMEHQEVSGGYEDDVARIMGTVPTDQDPTLFAVRVRRGVAQEVVKKILIKCITAQLGINVDGCYDLGILTVFTNDKESQYVYVEAVSKRHLVAGLTGLTDIYFTKITPVPLSNRRQLLMSCLTKTTLKVGEYARPRTGLYQQDLCQIVAVDPAKPIVTIKVVPRIDYSVAAVGGSSGGRRPFGKKASGSATHRLERRFFPFFAVAGQKHQNADGTWSWNGHTFDSEGYAQITINRAQLLHGEQLGKVSDKEMKDFTPERVVPENAAPVLNTIMYHCGDQVKVIAGQLRGLIGKVIEIKGKQGLLKLDQDRTLEVDLGDVSPYIPLNTNVIVTSGQYKGETGTVVALTDHTAVILSSQRPEEIEVLLADVQLATRYIPISTTKQRLTYRERDLVKLKPEPGSIAERVGMIVHMTPHLVMCLLPNNTLVRANQSDIAGKVAVKKPSFRDSQGNILHLGDTVKVTSHGAHVDALATVRQVYFVHVFLQISDTRQNFGYFVESNDHILSISHVGGSSKSGTTRDSKKVVEDKDRRSALIQPFVYEVDQK